MRTKAVRIRRRLPQFGIFGSGVVFCGMIGAWLVSTIEWRSQSIGIPVHTVHVGAPAASFDPWAQALTIRVNGRHHYFLNGNPISLQEIPLALGQSFKTRANWTVYVKGDPNAGYGEVVQAADAIRSAHGRVVLLTPSTR